jgi:hypothetical protein
LVWPGVMDGFILPEEDASTMKAVADKTATGICPN